MILKCKQELIENIDHVSFNSDHITARVFPVGN